MQEKKVVVIGGGTGTDITLAGLKRYTSQLTALVSTFDANSRSREQDSNNTSEGGPAADDVRNSLLALGADASTTQIMRSLFAYQLAQSAEHGGRSYTLGNLLISALTDITGGADLALKAAARVLNVQGQVLPLTLQPCALTAHLNDGTEVTIDCPADMIAAAAGIGLRHISLAEHAQALEAALDAIRSADIIVLGPADFYFNLLAPLQLEGVIEALAASRAVKIFVCNILTQPHTTDGWPASRFMRVMLENMGGAGTLDYVIVNSTSLALDALAIKAANGYFPVRLDLEECLSLGLDVIVRPVASPDTLQHDPEKLVRTILFLGGWRSARRSEKQGIFGNDQFEAKSAINTFTRSEAMS